jgi:chromosome segregation ATPase
MWTTAEITTIILAVVGFLATGAVAVISWFSRRAIDSNDEAIKELKSKYETLQTKRSDDLAAYQNKVEALRSEYETKLQRHYEKIGERLDGHAESVSRAKFESIHDIGSESDKIRKEIADLRDKVESKIRDLERELMTFQGRCSSLYVSKEDFIRESTQLETRIVATRRTLEGLDDALKGYLKE